MYYGYGYGYGMDPMYFLVILAFIFSMVAQTKVSTTFNIILYDKKPCSSRISPDFRQKTSHFSQPYKTSKRLTPFQESALSFLIVSSAEDRHQS